MMSPTKNETQNLKIFSFLTRRLAESFEGLNSSLVQSTGKLWSCKQLAYMGKLYLVKWNLAVSKGVNDSNLLVLQIDTHKQW